MFYDHERHEKRDKRPRVGSLMPAVNDQLWEQFDTYLKARGLDPMTARANNWYPSSQAGDGEPRIVMPAVNAQGFAYWQARAIKKDVTPRYQSPAVPRGDSVIQLWPLHKEYLPILILSEGPMDALAGAGGGIRSIALMGIHPSDETLNFIQTLVAEVQHVTFFSDRDAIAGAVDFLKRCLERGIPMTISDPSPYKDLAAIPLKRRQQILQMYTNSVMK